MRQEQKGVERNGTGQRGPRRGRGMEQDREGRNEAEREEQDGARWYRTVWDGTDRQGQNGTERNGTGQRGTEQDR